MLNYIFLRCTNTHTPKWCHCICRSHIHRHANIPRWLHDKQQQLFLNPFKQMVVSLFNKCSFGFTSDKKTASREKERWREREKHLFRFDFIIMSSSCTARQKPFNSNRDSGVGRRLPGQLRLEADCSWTCVQIYFFRWTASWHTCHSAE